MEWFGHQGRWGMSNFRDVDRQTGFLLPPSVDEWLPQRHLARFVVEVIDGWTCGHWSAAIAARVRHRTTLRCCWGCWFTVTRQECLRAGSWSAPPTIRWRFGSLRPMTIRTTTRSRRFGGGF